MGTPPSAAIEIANFNSWPKVSFLFYQANIHAKLKRDSTMVVFWVETFTKQFSVLLEIGISVNYNQSNYDGKFWERLQE